MFGSLGVAITVIVLLMVGWMLIQQIWGEVFAEELTDEDVLAERRSCGNCGCGRVCKNKSRTKTI